MFLAGYWRRRRCLGPIENRFNGESILCAFFSMHTQSAFGRWVAMISSFTGYCFSSDIVRHAQPKKRMKWRILFVNFVLLGRVDDDETSEEQYRKIVRYLWIKIERIKWTTKRQYMYISKRKWELTFRWVVIIEWSRTLNQNCNISLDQTKSLTVLISLNAFRWPFTVLALLVSGDFAILHELHTRQKYCKTMRLQAAQSRLRHKTHSFGVREKCDFATRKKTHGRINLLMHRSLQMAETRQNGKTKREEPIWPRGMCESMQIFNLMVHSNSNTIIKLICERANELPPDNFLLSTLNAVAVAFCVRLARRPRPVQFIFVWRSFDSRARAGCHTTLHRPNNEMVRHFRLLNICTTFERLHAFLYVKRAVALCTQCLCALQIDRCCVQNILFSLRCSYETERPIDYKKSCDRSKPGSV